MAGSARRQPCRVPQDRKDRFRLCRRTPAIWFFLNFYWWSKGWNLIDQAPDGKFFMNITPDQIAEGLDYYNQFLKDDGNPKSNLSVCLWGAPEIVEDMVSGNAAIASVPHAAGVQIVNSFKQRFPGKPLPFAAAPTRPTSTAQRRFLAAARSRLAPIVSMSMRHES